MTPIQSTVISETLIDKLKADLEFGTGNAAFELVAGGLGGTTIVSFNLGAVVYTKFTVLGGSFALKLSGIPYTASSAANGAPQQFVLKNRAGAAILFGFLNQSEVYLNAPWVTPVSGQSYRLNDFQLLSSGLNLVAVGSAGFDNA